MLYTRTMLQYRVIWLSLASVVITSLAGCTAGTPRVGSDAGIVVLCTPSGDGGPCTCPIGQVATASGSCVPASLCDTNNGGCSDNATCAVMNGAVQCTCNAGFTGNGMTCGVPCGGATCADHATCEANVCVCTAGYTGTGTTCSPIPSLPLGASCSLADPNSCNAGLTCVTISPTTMCTETCLADSDCGSTGDIENVCLNGECYRGCNPTIPDDCGRSDFGCRTYNGYHYCAPGCSASSGNSCPYGTSCGAVDNQCDAQPCQGNGQGSCAAGFVCATVLDLGQVCVADCRATGHSCPEGTTCNGQGACTGLSDVGATCADSSQSAQSTCEASYECLSLGNANQCSFNCGTNADCGFNGSSANQCLSQGQFEGNVCYRGCDSTNPGSCGRPDLVCVSQTNPGTGGMVDICVGDCRVLGASICEYGQLCSNDTGACAAEACTSSAACAAGDVCATVNGTALCVPDCRSNAAVCPTGTSCGGDGSCSTGAGIGLACADSSQMMQSTCAAGLICYSINGANVCSEFCTADSSCGANGSDPNTCWPNTALGSSVCYRGCDPTVSTSCGRTDFVCVSEPDPTTGAMVNVCLPDCRQQQGACTYGSTCSATTGQCVSVRCTAASGCPTGEVCASVNGEAVCVPDCTNSGVACPGGTTCDPHGACNVGADIGDTCADSSQMAQSTCDSGSICAAITAANSCTFDCVVDTDCGGNGPYANVCATSATLGSICYRGCDPSIADSCGRADMVCSPGTDAAGSAVSYCTPDCRVAGNACAYGSLCKVATGQCAQVTCTGLGQGTCATGQVCGLQNGSDICVPDCRLNTTLCPTGTTCDPTGVCNVGADVGAPCADSSQMAQSNCPAGYTCVLQTGVNMCTLACDPFGTGSECGQIGQTPNVCLATSNLLGGGNCYRGCNPTVSNSCDVTGLICAEVTNEAMCNTVDVCIADCTTQPAGFCTFGTLCDTTSDSSHGQCVVQTCTGTGQGSCATGQICATVSGAPACVPDCRLGSQCSAGLACDVTSGLCTVGAGIGASCADSSQMAQSTCGTGYSCVSIGGANQCTLQGCQEDSQCGTNGVFTNLCIASPGTGASLCYHACDPTNTASCGTGLLCGTQVDPNTGRGVNYCVANCQIAGASACTYGTMCEASGFCSADLCTGTGQGSCATGDLCATVGSADVCVPDCRNGGVTCPPGTGCDTTGVCNVGADVGDSCADSSQMAQSTCASGYSCYPITGVNMCTLTGCEFGGTACGLNGAYANGCVNDLCLRGCDPADSTTCNETGLVCAPTMDPESGSTVNVCVADCRQEPATYCSYPETCGSTSGLCTTTSCTGTGQGTCAAGQVCADINFASVCVADCRLSGATCPLGTTCNSTGWCAQGTGGLYDPCTGAGGCNGTLECICTPSFNEVCLQPCTTGTACSATLGPATCVNDEETGTQDCLVQCNPLTSICPPGSLCQTSPPMTGSFCMPQ